MEFNTTVFQKLVREPELAADVAKRRNPNENPLRRLTENLIDSLKLCNPSFKMVEKIPRRILTHPSEPHPSFPDDNLEHNLICRVHDELHDSEDGETYKVVDLLGTGTFGQVLRCRCVGRNASVAVKVIKNKEAYRKQSSLEIRVLKLLNNKIDPDNKSNIVRLLQTFDFKGHVCLVFEMLDYSLYDLLTQNQYRGLPLFVVQSFTRQILTALVAMQEANVVHCDLKPENIMISTAAEQAAESLRSISMDSIYDRPVSAMKVTPSPTASSCSPDMWGVQSRVSLVSSQSVPENKKTLTVHQGPNSIQSLKVIDFGSVCYESKTMFHYIQSRFYRSPEVLIGLPYNGAVDMWSLGCVCCEMFLGLPIFPGVSQHNQLSRIIEMVGMPSDTMLELSSQAGKYFKKTSSKHSPKKDQAGVSAPPQIYRSESMGANTESSGRPLTRCNSGSHGKLQAMHAIQSTPTGKYRVKTAAEYAKDTNTRIPVLKKYLKHDNLDDVILKYPYPQIPPGSYKNREGKPVSVEYIISREQQKRECFLHFLHGLLTVNPWERWTAKQAFEHPFITNDLFADRRDWTPPHDPKINERLFALLALIQAKESKTPPQKQSAPSVSVASSIATPSRVSVRTESPRNSDGNKNAVSGRSNNRQSVEYTHSTSQTTTVPDSTPQALPSGAVPIVINAPAGANPVPPPTTPPIPPPPSAGMLSVGKKTANHFPPPPFRPPLPRGPPPSAAAMSSSSYPPPLPSAQLLGPWASSEYSANYGANAPPPSPFHTPPNRRPSYDTPPQVPGVHMNLTDFSPRFERQFYMTPGEISLDAIGPHTEKKQERKPRALTQINLDQSPELLYKQPPPPGQGMYSSGGYRRESYAGSSSGSAGMVTDFELAILRTPTDQLRVFQSQHDGGNTSGFGHSAYGQYNCNNNTGMGAPPPPPPVPPLPPYPRGSNPPYVYGASNYGVAQSYDSYGPMVVQNAMQNYYNSMTPTCGMLPQFPPMPPLPPGPPGQYNNASGAPPVDSSSLSQRFGGMGLSLGQERGRGPPRRHNSAYSYDTRGGPVVPPSPQAPPQHIPSAPAQNSVRPPASVIQVGAEPFAGHSQDVATETEGGHSSASRSKDSNDDADPFFVFDET